MKREYTVEEIARLRKLNEELIETLYHVATAYIEYGEEHNIPPPKELNGLINLVGQARKIIREMHQKDVPSLNMKDYFIRRKVTDDKSDEEVTAPVKEEVVFVSADEPSLGGRFMGQFKQIELGGGSNPKIHPNVDVRADKNVDIVADFEKPLPLPDSEYDFVYSAFVLEHISWRNVAQFVKEIHRILKQGGRCVVITADLLEQCRIVANSVNLELPEPQKTFYGNFSCMIFGGQDFAENAHKSGLSQMQAALLFRESGFSSVRVAPLPNCSSDMVIEAFK